MGTRCITNIRSRWDEEKEWKTHAVIYRHCEGYPESQGRLLFDFLDGLVVINGIPGNPPKRYANGPGRLAAQIVKHMEDEGHSPNLMGAVMDCGQEFHYQIDVDNTKRGGDVSVTIFDGPVTFFGGGGGACRNEIFSGSVEELGAFLAGVNAA